MKQKGKEGLTINAGEGGIRVQQEAPFKKGKHPLQGKKKLNRLRQRGTHWSEDSQARKEPG